MSVNKFHNFILENKDHFRVLKEANDVGEKDNSYSSCIAEAIGAINRMLSFLAPSDPDVVDTYTEKKKDLADDLEASPSSHLKFWSSLDEMAANLKDELKSSNQWKAPKGDEAESKEKIDNLKKDLEAGNIDDEEFQQELKKMRSKVTSEGAKNVYFGRTTKAFDFYREGVRAFKDCASSMLKGKKASDLPWLDAATDSAVSILKSKKK